MDEKKTNEVSANELLSESLPVITEIVHALLNDLCGGEIRFTLFLTNGKMCGLAGDNGLEHTFEHLKEIMAKHDKGESNFVDMSNISHTEH